MVSIKDKDLYAIAGQEVANGVIDTGLWTKAFADSRGNDVQARALYIKMRVVDLLTQRDEQLKQLKQQARIQQQQNIEQQKQQALLAEQHETLAKQYEERLAAEKSKAEWDAMSWREKVAHFFGMFVIIGLFLFCLSVGPYVIYIIIVVVMRGVFGLTSFGL